MWVMLISKLPTEVSPPKMSLFWTVPWPEPRWVAEQKKRFGEDYDPDATVLVDEVARGMEPNWAKARKIHFAGMDVRVFPNEFTAIPPERMQFYLQEEAFELVAEGVASETMLADIKLDIEQRGVHDAALMDGCNPAQAQAVALGMDITMPDAVVPPVGWYRLKPEYARIYCDTQEMEEHRGHHQGRSEEGVAEEGRDMAGAAQPQGGSHVEIAAGRGDRPRRVRRGRDRGGPGKVRKQ